MVSQNQRTEGNDVRLTPQKEKPEIIKTDKALVTVHREWDALISGIEITSQ